MDQHGEVGVEEEVDVAVCHDAADGGADGSANDEGVGDEAHEGASSAGQRKNAPEGALWAISTWPWEHQGVRLVWHR